VLIVSAEQQAKIVVARSSYATLKVGLHSYEQKYVDCTRELGVSYKEAIRETDTVRYDAQVSRARDACEGCVFLFLSLFLNKMFLSIVSHFFFYVR
jgi:hypothetical protein